MCSGIISRRNYSDGSRVLHLSAFTFVIIFCVSVVISNRLKYGFFCAVKVTGPLNMFHQRQLLEQVDQHSKKYRSAKKNVNSIQNKVTKCGINSSKRDTNTVLANKSSMKKSTMESCDIRSTKVLKRTACTRPSSKFRTNKCENINRSHTSLRQIEGSHGDSRNVNMNKQNDSEQLNMLRNNTRCIYTKRPVINNMMLSVNDRKKVHEILQGSGMNNENRNRVNAALVDFPKEGLQPRYLENIIMRPDTELKYRCNPHVTVFDKGSRVKVQTPEFSKTLKYKESSLLSSSDHSTSNASSGSYYAHRLTPKISDKSIQCSLKSETNLTSLSSADESFAVSNPVQSLHFLISELHGMLRKNTNESVHRIIANMEKTLQNLNVDENKFVKQKNSSESVFRKSSAVLHSNSSPVKLSSTYRNNKIIEPIRDTDPVSAQSTEILRKDKELIKVKEDSLIHNLKKDIEKLKEAINYKDEIIDDALTRQKELKKSISLMKSEMEIMKQKYEKQTESLAKMAPLCIQLSDVNKDIPMLQDSLSKAYNQIENLTEEKKDLDIQVKFYKEKKEHYQMIISWKDATWEKFKNDIQCVIDMLLQHQQYLMRKPVFDSAVRQVNSLLQYVRSLSDMDKVNSPSYINCVKPYPSSRKLEKCKSIHTSSPVSSFSSTPNVSHSWDISRISDDNYNEKAAESEVVIPDKNDNAFDETVIKKPDNFNTSNFFSLQNEPLISTDGKNITHDKSSDINISTYKNQNILLKRNYKLDNTRKRKDIDNASDILKYRPMEPDTQQKLISKNIKGETIDTMGKDMNDMMNEIESFGKQDLDMFKNSLEIPDNIQIIMPPTGMSDISADNSEIDED